MHGLMWQEMETGVMPTAPSPDPTHLNRELIRDKKVMDYLTAYRNIFVMKKLYEFFSPLLYSFNLFFPKLNEKIIDTVQLFCYID